MVRCRSARHAALARVRPPVDQADVLERSRCAHVRRGDGRLAALRGANLWPAADGLGHARHAGVGLGAGVVRAAGKVET